MPSLEQNFLNRCPELPDDVCWPWEGYVKPTGYAVVSSREEFRQEYAHRYAWERAWGPVPADVTVDHRCHSEDAVCSGGPECVHRRCVNRAHLRLLTPSDHGVVSGYATRTGRCRRDHEMTPENTYQVKGRKPICRICHLQRQARYDRKITPADG